VGQTKSHSEVGKRPDTPEFNLVESGDSDDNHDQVDLIRTQMEAQIADFDDEE
jgi:hypothetical protein